MQVYIADIAGGQTRIFYSHPHCARRLDSRFVEANAMIRVAGGCISQDFGVNRGASGSRRTFGFNDINPCAFSQDKPVAIF